MIKSNFSIQICPKQIVPPFNYHHPLTAECPHCKSINFNCFANLSVYDEVICSICEMPVSVVSLVMSCFRRLKA